MKKGEFVKLITDVEQKRKRLKWTQAQIAALLGISQATYSRWLAHKQGPRNTLVLTGLRACAAHMTKPRSVKYARKTSKSTM